MPDQQKEPEPERKFDHSKCECHERDSSFTCAYCKTFGYYGHMEYDPNEKPETD